jgi:hypothetical protein
MPVLPWLSAGTLLLQAFRRFPHPARPLLGYHEVLVRGPSLTVPQRQPVTACTGTASSWSSEPQPAA